MQLPWDIDVTTVVIDGPPQDDCDTCGSVALITVTWTPADEAFGRRVSCFHPECLGWTIERARESADDSPITVEFGRYIARSPIAHSIGAAA